MTKPTIIGYNAQNTVTVHTGALDLVGALIDTAIAAGANRVNSLNFSVKDDTKARTEAIAIATRDAHAQADALASALNVKLGKVLKATTVSQERPIPIRMGTGNGDVGQCRDAGRTRRGHCAGDGFSHLRD